MTGRTLLLCGLVGLVGTVGACDGGAAKPTSSATSNTRRYPATGVTRKITLTISAFDWEVAPGAIYEAIGYNRQVPGPVLEADAGDRIELTLVNDTDEPHSAHTHVVEFDENSDGVPDEHNALSGGAAKHGVAPPHGKVTVTWLASYAGTFPYHDHAGEETDGMTAGLVGALVVHPTDKPKPDRMNTVVLMDMDLGRYKGGPPGVGLPDGGTATDAEYKGGHGYMHTMNGKAYPEWIPPFRAKVGERVRWGVVSLGREFHTFHVHGHRWVGADGVMTDAINLGPGTFSTFEWIEDNPGEWLFHCHVPDHMEGGMMGHYIVDGAGAH